MLDKKDDKNSKQDRKNLFKLHNGKNTGKPFPSPEELRVHLEHAKQGLMVSLEYEAIMAKIIRKKYTSLLEEGFSKSEALYLCARDQR
jgi:hypothetical protein